MINVGVVGLGHWGPNLTRNLAALPNARLTALCDSRRDRAAKLARQYGDTRVETDYRALMDDPDLDAIVVATPVHTHFEIARAALDSGKHVLVEKPLASSSQACRDLITRSSAAELTLMVGHVFIFNAAVRKVREYIETGVLGDIYYAYSQRLNLGILRQDVNALWNFAPHDISILNYWLGTGATGVVARGYSYIQPEVEDVVFATLDYPGGVGANVHVSWLDPRKVRRMTVVGTEKMVVYDDVDPDARVMLYDKGVARQRSMNGDGTPVSLGEYSDFGEFQLLLRAGDVLVPKLDFIEPLRVECQHFIDCIESGSRPLTDGESGLQVVEVLEAAGRSMQQDGRRVAIDRPGLPVT